ncbi:MAG: hypothetical protein QOF99_6235 [Pseudonocardiales bacterium]|nr:hypothetical protein [Pseudonocardiales bacterium]
MFDTLKTSELETELVALAGRVAAAQCRFLLLLAEFDAREGWGGPGIRSCVHWLSWRVGLSQRAGREQVRVARALVGLPLIAEEFGVGRLSYAKVRAVTRIATPDTEQALVDVALAGTASHVERVVRAARRAATSGQMAAARRSASWRWDEDGCLVLRATLPPEEGARLLGALQAQLRDGPTALSRADGTSGPDVGGWLSGAVELAHADGSSPADGQSGADQAPGVDRSLSAAEGGLSAGSRAGESGGSAEPAIGRSLEMAREHPPGVAVDRLAARRADALMALLAPDPGQHEVVVHLEVANGGARLDDALPVAVSTAERLACDARVRALIKDPAGNPLYLGRAHRGVNATQRTALGIRDEHRCRFPGCEHERYLHAHHVRHWLRGGPTDVDNLVLLCSFHHRLIHDHDYRASLDRNRFRVWRRHGGEVAAQHPAATLADVLSTVDLLAEVHVDDEAIVPAWTGERLDLDAVMSALSPGRATEAA